MAKKNKQKPWWLGFLLMAAGAVVGYLGGAYFLNDGAESTPIDWLELVGIILVLLVSFFLVILIHELGHVFGGLIMGNEFSMMIVGPLKLQKEDGKYHLEFNQNVAMAGGLALTLPTKVEGFKKRRAVVIGGGPFASLVLAIIAYLLFINMPNGYSKLLTTLLIGSGMLSAMIFVMTIIPMKAGGFMSDGMQLLMTFRGDAKAKQYANFMHLFALDNKGVLPKDLPETLFTTEQDKPIQDSFDLAFQQYLYYRAIDENDLAKAANLIQKMEAKIDLYPANFHPDVQADWVIFYSLIQPNEDKVNQLLKEMDGKKPTMSKVFLHAFEAVVAFTNGDMEKAKAFGEKVRTTTEKKGTTKLYQRILQASIR